MALASLLFASAATPHPRVPDRTLVLNGHALLLHFGNMQRPGARPLLVYATGDGGWHRKDLAAYKQLVSLGYPIVGFDARDYVTHLGTRETTTPGALAADYERIITEAKSALSLPPDHPVILVGVSRGADLSVVAAGQRNLRPEIAGVVAVALTREEEYVRRFPRLRLRGRRPAASAPAGAQMVMLYDYLPQLGTTPVAVIQSTRDKYLPADQARALFGGDTPYRWLVPVQARNHSFGGGRSQMYDAMRRALQWVIGVIAVQHGAGT